MKATLTNYRQSPRKVRLVADLVKGKPVARALAELSFLPKRAALPIEKLIRSGLANAKSSGVATENLIVKNLRVDKGTVLKRSMPRARGSAARILKRSSTLVLEMGEKAPKKAKKVKEAPAKK